MKRFYNIQASYILLKYITIDIKEGLEYFEDFVDHNNTTFIEKASKPHKHTLLHIFLENYELNAIDEELHAIYPSENIDFYKIYLKLADIDSPHWLNKIEIDEHFNDLNKLLNSTAFIMAEAAFEILFNDKVFLHEFQLYLQKIIKNNNYSNISKNINKKGFINRLHYLPKWLQKAIYFRDRGRCQICMKDVSGQVYQFNTYHLDHIIPLADGGTNDPTNFQLLCKECNLTKGTDLKRPINRQIRYWDI